MPNVIRIKRRTSGAAGAPSSLKAGELAYNNMDNTIYAGFGDDGSGNATSVKPVGGEGTFAKLDSPALTGTPTAPTAAVDTNTTQLATTAFVVGQAYAKLASPTFTGTPAAPTAAADTNTTQIATTAFVIGQAYAKLASPALTGTPTAPTAAADTSTTQLATTAFVVGQAASTNPVMDGAAAVGTSLKYARADHVHPTDTSRAPLASPGLTGTPTAPTAAADTNTTQLATTAFVIGQASSTSPAMDGTATIGTSVKFARADHIHPTDTSRAPLASPTFTGVPAAPTATVDTSTTQLATTAFVIGQASAVAGAALGTAAVGSSTRYARADHVHAMPTLDQIGGAAADVSLNSKKIINLADPVNAQDAATKAYVDASRSGLDVKQSVRLASTGNVTVTYTATGGTSTRGQITSAPNALDGINLAAGDRILLKDQTAGAQNGIWVVTTLGTGASGVWDRADDFNADAEVTSGAFTFVSEGTTNADSGWVLTTDDPITIGGASGTALTFAQFSGAGQVIAGSGLTKTGNTLNVGAGTGITANADDIALATSNVLSLFNLATNGIVARTAANTVTARTITGTANRITITNGDGVSGNPTVDIASTYVGQNTITTLGTISTGVWNGSAIGVAYGGTGVATLTGLVKGNGTAAFSAAVAGTDYHDTNSVIDGGTF